MRTATKVVFLIAIAASFALAADKPNFSGSWTLDAAKSDFGPMPPPTGITVDIDHKDPDFSMTQATTGGAQGDQTVTMKCSTDGKETTNQLMGNDIKTTGAWDGNSMVMSMGGDAFTLKIKLSLSDDGKVLTEAWHIGSDQGDIDFSYVLNKK